MKDTTTSFRKNVNYIFTVLAFVILVFSIGLALYDYKLEQDAINIKATINSLDYKQGKYQATIKYKVDKETYRPTITLKDNSYAVNDEISIKYNMNNPGQLIENDHYTIYIPGLVISILIILITFKETTRNLKKSFNIKNLKTKGIYIYANITDVFIDNKKRKSQGRYAYKLRCKYTNPTDNNEYIFESEPSYLNFNEIFSKYNNQTIIVYIDKNNTSNYYVDLDSLFPHIELVDVGSLMEEKKEQPKTEDVEGEEKEQNEKEDNPDNQKTEKEGKSQ